VTGWEGGAVPAFWPNAEALASMVAIAAMVVLRMSDAPEERRDGAGVEFKNSAVQPERRDRIRSAMRFFDISPDISPGY
jgi:hypothetical protein